MSEIGCLFLCFVYKFGHCCLLLVNFKLEVAQKSIYLYTIVKSEFLSGENS